MSHCIVRYTYLPIGSRKGGVISGTASPELQQEVVEVGEEDEEEEEVQAAVLPLIQPKQPSYKHSRHLFSVSF